MGFLVPNVIQFVAQHLEICNGSPREMIVVPKMHTINAVTGHIRAALRIHETHWFQWGSLNFVVWLHKS